MQALAGRDPGRAGTAAVRNAIEMTITSVNPISPIIR